MIESIKSWFNKIISAARQCKYHQRTLRAAQLPQHLSPHIQELVGARHRKKRILPAGWWLQCCKFSKQRGWARGGWSHTREVQELIPSAGDAKGQSVACCITQWPTASISYFAQNIRGISRDRSHIGLSRDIFYQIGICQVVQAYLLSNWEMHICNETS